MRIIRIGTKKWTLDEKMFKIFDRILMFSRKRWEITIHLNVITIKNTTVEDIEKIMKFIEERKKEKEEEKELNRLSYERWKEWKQLEEWP
jgi:wyosine [tRNA(Phe)-imidazoG37] synthetase (radical SAM superfamily)